MGKATTKSKRPKRVTVRKKQAEATNPIQLDWLELMEVKFNQEFLTEDEVVAKREPGAVLATLRRKIVRGRDGGILEIDAVARDVENKRKLELSAVYFFQVTYEDSVSNEWREKALTTAAISTVWQAYRSLFVTLVGQTHMEIETLPMSWHRLVLDSTPETD